MIFVVVTAPGRPLAGNLSQAIMAGGHQACWVADTRGRGQVANYWTALRCALDICERYQQKQILVCEDDIELCQWALDYIASFGVPADLALVEWFNGRWPPFLSNWPMPQVFGSATGTINLQAVTWPVRSLRALLDRPRPAWWKDKHGGDDLLTCIAADLGWKWGSHIPNLVQHVGAQSLVDPSRTLTGNRVSRNYPGADFDARTLWAGKAVGHAGE